MIYNEIKLSKYKSKREMHGGSDGKVAEENLWPEMSQFRALLSCFEN